MKKIFLILLILVFSLKQALAAEIPDVKEGLLNKDKQNELFEVVYPIRNNALVVILQPCPDNSGDFMFTVCNKKSHCYQTSMQNNEVRYIGLFLEDLGQNILSSLNEQIFSDNFGIEQEKFRTLYADYMNCYDDNFGILKSFKDKSKK